jgi:hypothetical protein
MDFRTKLDVVTPNASGGYRVPHSGPLFISVREVDYDAQTMLDKIASTIPGQITETKMSVDAENLSNYDFKRVIDLFEDYVIRKIDFNFQNVVSKVKIIDNKRMQLETITTLWLWSKGEADFIGRTFGDCREDLLQQFGGRAVFECISDVTLTDAEEQITVHLMTGKGLVSLQYASDNLVYDRFINLFRWSADTPLTPRLCYHSVMEKEETEYSSRPTGRMNRVESWQCGA